jgi:hypothetical protein
MQMIFSGDGTGGSQWHVPAGSQQASQPDGIPDSLNLRAISERTEPLP